MRKISLIIFLKQIYSFSLFHFYREPHFNESQSFLFDQTKVYFKSAIAFLKLFLMLKRLYENRQESLRPISLVETLKFKRQNIYSLIDRFITGIKQFHPNHIQCMCAVGDV